MFGGPCNKSPSILGSILGPPIVGNSHICLQSEFRVGGMPVRGLPVNEV